MEESESAVAGGINLSSSLGIYIDLYLYLETQICLRHRFEKLHTGTVLCLCASVCVFVYKIIVKVSHFGSNSVFPQKPWLSSLDLSQQL